MRRIMLLAVATALAVGTASAQVPLKPELPGLLRWTPEQQSEGYRSIESYYRTSTVPRGAEVQPFAKADRTIEVAYSHGGRSWTVDEYMKAYNVSGVLVLKNGKVLLERYGLGRKLDDRWISFSVTKSITSTLVGAAIQDGKIKSLDDAVTLYIPELKGSAYDGASIRQLLTMSSGVKWSEDYTDPNSDVVRAGAAVLDSGVIPIVSYMRRLPRETEPGATFHYNTGEANLVGVLVSNAVGKSLSDYLSEKIWKAYGMERDAVWMVDVTNHERGGCCMAMTLADYGRFGQFILDGGKAAGRPVVPDWWVRQATTAQIANGAPPGGYGYYWWIGSNGGYAAAGIFGQLITTFRDDRLVIVVNSAWPSATGRELFQARSAFVTAVREAAKGM
jgi:CubicO group peptidase (beta-lactamase class C family)